MRKQALWLVAFAVGSSAVARADGRTVEVTLTGSVDYNVIFYLPMSGVLAGDPVTLSFQLDTSDFVDGTVLPRRGYAIDPTTFSLELGGVAVGLASAPGLVPYFAIRDDVPGPSAMDGFYLTTSVDTGPGPIEYVGLLLAHAGGSYGPFNHYFALEFPGTQLSSSVLESQLGTFDASGSTGLSWSVYDGAQQIPLSVQFSELSITLLDPGTAFCFGVGCPCGNDDPADVPTGGCASSTGSGAVLCGRGSTSVSADDLLLFTVGCPPNNTGLFFMGGSTSAPMLVGDGLACTGGLFRFFPSVAGASGELTLTSPIAAAPVGAISVGDKRHFQSWTRDVSCGPPPSACATPCAMGSNLSNGYTVSFTP